LFPDKLVWTRTADGLVHHSYAEIAVRSRRLANALGALGVGAGDRVGTFAWNSHRHLELYLAVPAMGAVLHTVNIRLFAEQIEYIVNHAEDRVLFLDDSLLSLLEPIAPRLTSVRAFVVMGDGPVPDTVLPNVHRYEDLLAAASDRYEWPALDEGTPAAMCYTSGTTGHPKGVVYTHRALVLQSFAQGLHDTFGLCERDVILAVVPMFHANCWGLPYSGTMVGATQIYPGAHPTPEDVCRITQDLEVTVTAGVPTVLLGMLQVLDETPYDLSSLRAVPCGGSAVPESLIKPRSSMGEWSDAERRRIRATQGMPLPGVEIRVVDTDGRELPWDGASVGELQIRGPWITAGYYKDDRTADAFDDGWFRTGDVVTIDENGYVRITDRTKDVIKSGGEWISSVELENAIMGHPAVAEAAVIGLPHPTWQERPLACVVAKPGAEITTEEILTFLAPKVARWWLPSDVVFVDELPKTSVGKFAKRTLRERLQGHTWPDADPATR
jgi:fatty-acyl-CoA synthase